MNLLFDSCRKCIEIVSKLSQTKGISGWRKGTNWKQKLKSLMRTCWQIQRSGGLNKEERIKKAVNNYLEKAYELEAKVNHSISILYQKNLTSLELTQIIQAGYFQDMLIKHLDLIERRLLQKEIIPHSEKIFSLFEPHTQWINKGKQHPSVELGRKILVTTDQYGLAIHYKVMDQLFDANELIPLVEYLLQTYGENSIQSLSMDKGFSSKENNDLLKLYIPELIMPKKGRLSKIEKEQENHKKFKLLRKKHSAIESNINCLEHHGLNRCPDKGFNGFKRYTGFGILAYNCHKIGNKLLEFEQQKQLKKAA